MLLQWVLSHQAESLAICGSCIILVLAFPSLLTFYLTPDHEALKTASPKNDTNNLIKAFQARLKAWAFLIRGPTMIQDGYEKVKKAPHG